MTKIANPTIAQVNHVASVDNLIPYADPSQISSANFMLMITAIAWVAVYMLNRTNDG